MTVERKAEVAKELGLESIPKPRYDDLPEVHDVSAVQERWNFMKAIAFVDPLASATFMNYLPSRLAIDQSMNAREYRRGWSWCVHLDRSKPIPVNRKITAATGITSARNEKNWYTWLAQHILRVYTELGARAMAPVLVWRTHGERRHGHWLAVPVLGVIFKLDRTPPYGRAMEDMVAQVGVLHPSTTEAKNKVLPAAVVEMAGEGASVRDSLTADAAPVATENRGAILKNE